METTAILTPNNAWKSHKRFSEHDSDNETEINISSPNNRESAGNLGAVDEMTNVNKTKRFKGMMHSALDDSCFESPVNVSSMLKAKRIFDKGQRFLEPSSNAFLSPITEISKNLNDTSLDSPHCKSGGVSSLYNHCADPGFVGDDDGATPIKRFRRMNCGLLSKSKLFNQDNKFADEEDAEFIATTMEEQQEMQHHQTIEDKIEGDEEISNFQIQRSARNTLSSRRLNLDTSMHDLAAMDELSFYNDEELLRKDNEHFTAPPQLMGLLSPEGSPQHFQIVDKSSKFLQPRNKILANKTQNQQNASNNSSTATQSSNQIESAKNFRMFHSLSSSGSMESSMDDEYMEFFDMENLDQASNATQTSCGLNFPSDLKSLISGHIIKNSPVKTPEMRRPSVRRCLSMTESNQQPKTPETANIVNATSANTPFNTRLNANCCFKRPDPPSSNCSPVQTKRYRGGEEKENLDGSFNADNSSKSAASTATSTARPSLRKCMSMNDAEIMSALNRCESTDEPDLIGDFSKPYALPLMSGRHRDLKSISSNTVARLLNGEFNENVSSYKIIDCRYPYEFEGGHIRGAKNLYTQEQIIEEFLTQTKTEQQHACNEASGNKRNIIIFHCEFSSERGPKLSRFLRNYDRARNTTAYPALDYPEVYLLHNGYKEFFETHAELCDPIAYRPMLEPSYNEEYRHFRAKSKSWNGDGLGGTTQRLKKSRSRLML